MTAAELVVGTAYRWVGAEGSWLYGQAVTVTSLDSPLAGLVTVTNPEGMTQLVSPTNLEEIT